MARNLRSVFGVIEAVNDVVEIDVADAGSVMVAVADTPSASLTIAFEGYDGNRWVGVTTWDQTSTSPIPQVSQTISSFASTRIGNVVNFSQFRVRCSSFTAPASVILTADSGVISVPPMLGAIQNVRALDGAVTPAADSRANIRHVSTAGDNAVQNFFPANRIINAYHMANTGGTWAYVKIYNTSSLPTSAMSPRWVVPIPPGQVVTMPLNSFALGNFSEAGGLRITGGKTDNDETAVAAGQVFIQLGYN